ncbi:GNAT family N-acetyltransferase [Solemya velum gill symbiont]|uniref:GNAT family N-acetyltransferase n=1 Tax=Solemya velum gill symbiont TaxID=2340 RepID=UPI0009975DE3|nr:GNAT family N-acetyltransferase [Solemya velum gill symbiont]OOZ51166.1 GNAT family N-acetyltransferase [Solemya velum gill symbiont]
MKVEVVKADYSNPRHQSDIPMLLDAYASGPMGGGVSLDGDVKASLVRELSGLPHAFSVIAYVDDCAAGLINCFEVFSTFACKPLINIHDVMVLDGYRGLGISQVMLEKVEEIAISKGCCKLTLEVLANNTTAKAAYRKFGFCDYELDPKTGSALFWQKKLTS